MAAADAFGADAGLATVAKTATGNMTVVDIICVEMMTAENLSIYYQATNTTDE